MALSDKNIVITPNIGQSADPKIVFSGADASTGAQNVTLEITPKQQGTLDISDLLVILLVSQIYQLVVYFQYQTTMEIC